MVTKPTVFTLTQESSPKTDSETNSETDSYYDYDNNHNDDDDSINSLDTYVFLEAVNELNYCFRCEKLIESDINPDKCTCISEGKLPQNESCPYCNEKYNADEEKCGCFCKDCNEINSPEDDQLCACEREAEEEFNRSFECKGYNYCYKCCAVIKTNTNNTHLCTCIADGILPQNVECVECLEIYNEGEEPCECIQEMMYNDMMKAMEPSFKEMDKIYATVIQTAWRKYTEINLMKDWENLVINTPPKFGSHDADRIATILHAQMAGKNVNNLIRKMIREKKQNGF